MARRGSRREIDVDLFAGAGGLAVGLRSAGVRLAHLYEQDAKACETLRRNAKSATATIDGKVHEGDVADVQWEDIARPVGVLAAGVPCQPFSNGGKHLANKDGRNLFPELLRATRALRPKVMIVENVAGLLRESFEPYFNYIIRQLETPSARRKPREPWRSHNKRLRQRRHSTHGAPEYVVQWRLMEAANYGVPQNRRRVIIVATRSDIDPFKFPEPTHSKDALLRAQRERDYWDERAVPKRRHLPEPEARLLKEPDGLLPWVTVRDALEGLPRPKRKPETAWNNHWSIPGARLYYGHMGSILDWPSKAIKAGVHGVPGGENCLIDRYGKHRYYTFREAARIQTFPDEHEFVGNRSHITRQLGNAVPCLLAEAIANNLTYIREMNGQL